MGKSPLTTRSRQWAVLSDSSGFFSECTSVDSEKNGFFSESSGDALRVERRLASTIHGFAAVSGPSTPSHWASIGGQSDVRTSP
jgi:hypothetical protein